MGDDQCRAVDDGVAGDLGLDAELARHPASRQPEDRFDDVVAQINVRFQLRYFGLTDRYQVSRLDTGFRSSYHSLEAALERVGALDDFALIEAHYLESEAQYRGTIALSLDAEALPLPLRPQAYLSPQWRFASEEYTWSIR